MIQTREDSIDPQAINLPADYSPDPIKLEEMIQSQISQGMFHNPIIKENKDIVAGRLRVKAAQFMKWKSIKVTVVPNDLTPDDYSEISLHENLKRGNLRWDDEVILEKQLHELRLRQNGVEEAKKGKKADWGLRETAQELNLALGGLSMDLKIANAIMLDPSLRRVKDKSTALKVINENIKRSNQEMGVSAPVSCEINVCHCGHSDVILKIYPDNTFDACITDPPWLEFRDTSLTRDEFTLPVFKEVYRVLKQNSFLYMFVSTQDWMFYYVELANLGFSIQKWPLIWAKEGSLSHGRRTWEYQRDYEPILLAVKGSPALTNGFLSSVMSTKVVPSQSLVHPNEKPTSVLKRLIDNATYEGSIILDPFAGSGSTLVACKETNRRFVGIEKNPGYHSKIQERIK
jgi:adenine-specific DNA-methyltransferase